MALDILGRLGLFHHTQALIPPPSSSSRFASSEGCYLPGTFKQPRLNFWSNDSRRLKVSSVRPPSKIWNPGNGLSSCLKRPFLISDTALYNTFLNSGLSFPSVALKDSYESSPEDPQTGKHSSNGSCNYLALGRMGKRRLPLPCSSSSRSVGLLLPARVWPSLVLPSRDTFLGTRNSDLEHSSLRISGRLKRQVSYVVHHDFGGWCHGEIEFSTMLQQPDLAVRAARAQAAGFQHGVRLQSSVRGNFTLSSEGQVLEDPWQGVASVFPLDRLHPDRQYEGYFESDFCAKIARFRLSRSTCYFRRSLSTPITPARSLTSARPRQPIVQDELMQRHILRRCIPHSRDTPPKRDTGIASEQEWGINLKNEKTSESGINAEGGSWYRESGEDLGENGYRCRWTVMGGRSADGSSEWKEAWWEKSDWTGYKELGAEKSGKNAQGDTWWETWQEVLRQDDWSNLARIEKSAQKQAKSGSGSAGWYEKWWEKYNAKGWSEKGAHKYGRLNDQGWWEKWGEQYDGRGAVLKWTDKWAETDVGTKWGDKWEEKFDHGVGTRRGETWHFSAGGERWSRTWGEEHFGSGRVHKYGKSTSGESWDNLVEEGTFYQAEPHYGWADAVGNSVQLLAIEALERPPGIYPDLDLGMTQE